MGQFTSTVKLTTVQPGQRLTVSATKGAGRGTGAIVVRDDNTVYAEMKGSNGPIGQKSFKWPEGKNLRVEIDFVVDGKPALGKNIVTSSDITDQSGVVKCTSLTICSEDENDNDYTDLVVNIIATNKW